MSRRSMLFLAALFIALTWPIVVSAKVCEVGKRVEVKQKGLWYLGIVEKVGKRKCYIRFDRYDQSWDGWFSTRSIRKPKSLYNIGETVFVKWKNDWWPAEVLNIRRNKYKIHYKGHSSLWDEWVMPDRISRYHEEVIHPQIPKHHDGDEVVE